ncbi:GL25190 [Drosophila persimilis]|uniref:GL25190 n=1 Tax=Drosophila persimilis TaxID=7234 RepID=B4GU55_DROPE|nr:GL25190 [Drosophila persimilis]
MEVYASKLRFYAQRLLQLTANEPQDNLFVQNVQKFIRKKSQRATCVSGLHRSLVSFEEQMLLLLSMALRWESPGDDIHQYHKECIALSKLMDFSVDAQSDTSYFRELWDWSGTYSHLETPCPMIQLYCNYIMAMLTNMSPTQLNAQNAKISTEAQLRFEREKEQSWAVARQAEGCCYSPEDETPEQMLSLSPNQSVTNIEGVLLPTFNKKNQEFYASTDGCCDRIVKVDSTVVNLRSIALGLAAAKPICLSPFVWLPGVLTQAVMHGYWLLLEDLDAATQDTYTILSSLLERQCLSVPGFRDSVKIEPGFQLLVTVRGNHMAADNLRQRESSDKADNKEKYVALPFEQVTLSSSPNSGRLVSTRDLIKLCQRSNAQFSVTSAECAYFVFQNAVDVFYAFEHFANEYNPDVDFGLEIIKIGRASLLAKSELLSNNENGEQLSEQDLKRQKLTEQTRRAIGQTSVKRATFSFTRLASCILERIAVCVSHSEPMLLVRETGVGKTSSVQSSRIMVCYYNQ